MINVYEILEKNAIKVKRPTNGEVYPEGEELVEKIEGEGVLEALVVYGVNNGFDKQLVKAIRGIAEIKHEVLGNSRLTRKKVSRLDEKYDEIKKEIPSECLCEVVGYNAAVLEQIRVTRQTLCDLAALGGSPIAEALASDASAKLDMLEDAVLRVVDRTSASAREAAEAISRSIDSFRRTVLLDIMEGTSRKIDPSLLSGLDDACVAAEKWGSRWIASGNAAPRVIETTSYDPKSDQLAISFSERVGSAELMKQLAFKKQLNDNKLNTLSATLISAVGKREDAKAELELIKALSDRDALIRRENISAAADEYIRERIKNEDDFAAFEPGLSQLVGNLCSMLSDKKRLNKERYASTLDALNLRLDAWKKTKSDKWRGETIMITELEKKLNGLIDKTVEDLGVFVSRLGNLGDDDAMSATSVAKDAIKKLGAYKTAVSDYRIPDTEEGAALVKEISDIIIEIRNQTPKFASSGPVRTALERLGATVARIGGLKESGRKIKTVVPEIGVGGIEAFKNEEADELTAAIFVTEKMSVNKEFFEAMRARTQASLSKSFSSGDFTQDKIWASLTDRLNNLADLIRSKEAEGAPDEIIDMLYDQFEEAKAGRDDREHTITENIRMGIGVGIDALEFQRICDRFESIATLFTSENFLPYTVRAQIMVETEMYDFRELFERYIVAVNTGNGELIADIDDKIVAMKSVYDRRSTLKREQERRKLVEGERKRLDGEQTTVRRERPKIDSFGTKKEEKAERRERPGLSGFGASTEKKDEVKEDAENQFADLHRVMDGEG